MSSNYTEDISFKESFLFKIIVIASMAFGVLVYFSGGLIPLIISQLPIFTVIKRKPVQKAKRYLLNFMILLTAVFSIGLVVGTDFDIRPL